MAKIKNKKPHKQFSPSLKKEPRTDICKKCLDWPAWQLNTIDYESDWGWMELDRNTLVNNILKKISGFESMKWSEIKNRKNHLIQVSKIIPRARKRLQEIEMDDVDELFSLRLTGKNRICGIMEGHILKILWWDPNHQICPTDKK